DYYCSSYAGSDTLVF
nr:immunoglobulin light chain junction region [Macaca mulatta]